MAICRIDIDLDSLRHNVRALKALARAETRFCAVIKADAYGHGLLPTARAALAAGADQLAIGSVEEADTLRSAGIRVPILKVVPTLPEEMEASLAAGIEEMVCDLESARELSRVAGKMGTPARVHLNVDTGMGRKGVRAEQAPEVAAAVAALPHLRLVGLMTHFAEADDPDSGFTETQIRLFRDVIAQLSERGIRPEMIHAANSAGLIHFPESHFSMVRPGIALYGARPNERSGEIVDLRPVMSFRTKVAQLRELPAGATISYGRTYRLDRAARIATLPVGYSDGLLRSLSNRGEVLIGGRRHPIVGRVTMNLINVRIAHQTPVRVGDEAVLLGSQGTEAITAEEMAAWAGTISYEVLTSLGGSAHRKRIEYHGAEGERGSTD